MTFLSLIRPGILALFALILFALCIWGYLRARKSMRARGRAGQPTGASTTSTAGRDAGTSTPAGRRVGGVFARLGASPGLAWLRRALISALMVTALAGPAIPAEEVELTSNVEIVLAVDRTGSMAAEDGPDGAPRLDAVRRDIVALVDATAGARYAVVTWDSESRVELPFTTDSSAVASFAEVLHQEVSEFSAGSSMDLPVATLEELLASAAEQRPQNARYLVLLTDGESTGSYAQMSPEQLAATWAPLEQYIDGGAVIGYGTDQGGPMKRYLPGQGLGVDADDQGSESQYITDDSGSPGISKIDVPALTAIADALGLELLLNPPEDHVEDLGIRLMEQSTTLPDRQASRMRYRYVVWIPALAICLLLVWEVYADARELARLRRTGAI